MQRWAISVIKKKDSADNERVQKFLAVLEKIHKLQRNR